MQIKRRDFLKQSALGVGGMWMDAQLSRAAEIKTGRFDPYDTVALNKSGIKTSRLCLGTGMKGGNRLTGNAPG